MVICKLAAKNIFGPFMTLADFVKDMLQVAILTAAVGGIGLVFAHPSSFSSIVSNYQFQQLF